MEQKIKKPIKVVHYLKPLVFFTICLFILILWIPIIQMNFSFIPEMKSTEKRLLAQKPILERPFITKLHQFQQSYEKYFNDNFGLRNYLVMINDIINIKMGFSTHYVIPGRNGWLFYDNPTDGINIKDYHGKANFSDEELTQIKINLGLLSDSFLEKKIKFIVVLTPNKHTIYSEYLPFNIINKTPCTTRADQLSTLLKELDFDYLDLRPVLLESKKNNPTMFTYYMTDTHWNSFGAFLGYKEIIKKIKKSYPVIKELNLSDFDIVKKENRGEGDLALFLNLQNNLYDIRYDLIPKFKKQAVPDHYKQLKEGDLAFKVNNSHLPTLLMFKDSFATDLIPFLSENFSKSIFTKARTLNDFSLIESEKPDIVILEFAERFSGEILLPREF